jgi:hypothetical protein
MTFLIVTARPGNRGSMPGKVNGSLSSTALGQAMWLNQPSTGIFYVPEVHSLGINWPGREADQ